MRVIAFTDASMIYNLLVHMGQPTTPTRIAPARGPPPWQAVGTVTLPLQIYSMIKIAVTPEVNAETTLYMLLTLALIIIASRLSPGLLGVDQKSP